MSRWNPEPAEVRFWRKVAKSDGCWLWTACIGSNGYAEFKPDGYVRQYGHRYSWELHNGPIPADRFVLHKCDVRHCVRPDHLFLGTNMDNVRDMMAKGRVQRTCGERHHRARISDETAAAIRREYVRGASGRLAAKYCLPRGYVYQIARGNGWKHLENRR